MTGAAVMQEGAVDPSGCAGERSGRFFLVRLPRSVRDTIRGRYGVESCEEDPHRWAVKFATFLTRIDPNESVERTGRR